MDNEHHNISSAASARQSLVHHMRPDNEGQQRVLHGKRLAEVLRLHHDD
jgi:hypothetical protein